MKTLLIVDDLYTNRMILSKIVEQLGFECVEASNGKEALEIIGSSIPDLIIMDIEMPVMNGIETTKHIRKVLRLEKSTLPIYAVTAHDPRNLPDDFADAGFNGMISKPFTIEKFKMLTVEF